MSDALERSREKYGNGYYARKLEQGLQFQDVVTRALYQRGIVVVGYASRRFQNAHGENMLGAEIKNDRKYGERNPPALWIEYAEKAHPDRPHYTPSGIDRGDNSWLFVIGDARRVWIFSTKYLQMLRAKYQGTRWESVETPTSRAVLVPLPDAERYCLRRLNLDGEGASDGA